ncbi:MULTISPECIES: helix-turn-helix domain-containing protein [Pseudomonas]
MDKVEELRGETMKTGPDQIFTLDELAAYLKVGKRTLYLLVAQEEIPAFKVGGTWRFRRSDIDRWIEDRSPTETRKGGDARR